MSNPYPISDTLRVLDHLQSALTNNLPALLSLVERYPERVQEDARQALLSAQVELSQCTPEEAVLQFLELTETELLRTIQHAEDCLLRDLN